MSTLAEKLTRTKNAVNSIRTTVEKTNDEPIEEVVSAVEDLKNSGGGTPVELEEKDINFYDYDGTLLYSYTLKEFDKLEELPPKPDGYNWNWTLANIKAERKPTDVGVTTSILEVYIDMPEQEYKVMYIYFSFTNKLTSSSHYVYCDWGDGSARTQHLVRANSTSNCAFSHSYSSPGIYKIKISSSSYSYSCRLEGNTNQSNLANNSSAYDERSITKLSYIKHLIIGTSTELGSYALSRLYNLETLMMNGTFVSNALAVIADCYRLKKIIFSNKATYLAQSSIINNHRLYSLTIPNSVVTLKRNSISSNYVLTKLLLPKQFNFDSSVGSEMFSNNYSLTSDLIINLEGENNIVNIQNHKLLYRLKITGSVSTIQSFSGCVSLKRYDFTELISIPTLNGTNSFPSQLVSYRILVPETLYNEWISATNWSTFKTYIYCLDENGEMYKP